MLPLAAGTRVYADGLEVDGAVGPDEADVAIVRRNAPFEPRTNGMLETLFHAGDLDFKQPELGELLDLARRMPTVLVLHLERPAVIPDLAETCAAVVGVFGASDEAVLDVLFGRAQPEGRLPFELPSSMAAVREQLPDVPGDSRDPLFRFGHGLGETRTDHPCARPACKDRAEHCAGSIPRRRKPSAGSIPAASMSSFLRTPRRRSPPLRRVFLAFGFVAFKGHCRVNVLHPIRTRSGGTSRTRIPPWTHQPGGIHMSTRQGNRPRP